VLLLTSADVSNPGSFEDVVDLLIPELQRRGIYWTDYKALGGTARENLHSKPGEALLPREHPGGKMRWDASPSRLVTDQATPEGAVEAEVVTGKGSDIASTTISMQEVKV
jgi:hypothetical protein